MMYFYFFIVLLFSSFMIEARPISRVEYLRTLDGDTIEVNIRGVHPVFGEKIKVRFADIDAPEIKSKNECEKRLAVKAKEYVEDFLDGAYWISLSDIKRGTFFRLIAKVYKVKIGKDRYLGDELLDQHLAVPYGDHKKADWCHIENLYHIGR